VYDALILAIVTSVENYWRQPCLGVNLWSSCLTETRLWTQNVWQWSTTMDTTRNKPWLTRNSSLLYTLCVVLLSEIQLDLPLASSNRTCRPSADVIRSSFLSSTYSQTALSARVRVFSALSSIWPNFRYFMPCGFLRTTVDYIIFNSILTLLEMTKRNCPAKCYIWLFRNCTEHILSFWSMLL